MLVERGFKVLLVGAIGLFFSLAIFNNLTDYAINFAFVQHVLAMDTVFPTSTLTWRAITNPTLQHGFYWTIIAWEIVTASVCWLGALRLIQHVRSDAKQFNAAKSYALAGLTLSATLWLVAFWCIGGEWFAMWQSPIWNGQPIAFRMFTITAIAFFLVRQPDLDA